MGTYRAVKIIYRGNFSEERPYEREFRGMENFEPVSRSHDGFVDILQVGRNETAGYYYCVMELADDATFGRRINPELYQPKTLGSDLAGEGKLSFQECVRVGASLAAALAHLHESGLIHRDIKPSNIVFINGIPKIADIGLVVGMGESHSLVGTEGFMPPEGPGSPQADIYSLGKVLYEISTGRDRRAFPELPTDVTEIGSRAEFIELNEVILRACERDVKRRYATAEQMHRDLLLLQAGKSVRRLRLLEQRMAFLKKVAVFGSLTLFLVGGVFYQANREMKMASERRQQQVGRNIAYGTRFIDEGDFFGALPSFVEALALDGSDPLRQQTHRLRIGSVLAQCPRIVDLRFLDSQINCAQLSSDGRFVFVAGADGLATFQEVGSQNDPALFIRNSAELEGAAFSSDGKWVVTTSKESVKVWDFATRKELLSLSPPATVYNAQFSPDKKLLLTASGNDDVGYVLLWNVETGEQLAEICRSEKAYRFACFSPDGSQFMTAGENGLAEIWNTQTLSRVGEPIKHTGWVYSAAFSPDSQKVVTASYDGVALVSDAHSGRPILPPMRHPAGVKSASFSPDGRYVVTACWDFTARLWRTSDGRPVYPFLKHAGKHVNYASFTPDGRHVLTANGNGVLSLWDLSPLGYYPALNQFLLSPDGQRYAINQSNNVAVYSAGASSSLSRFPVDPSLTRLILNSDGSRLLALSSLEDSQANNRQVQLFDTLRGQPISQVFSIDRASSVAFLDEEGSKLVALNLTNAEIREASRFGLLHSLKHQNLVRNAWPSEDGSLLVTATGSEGNIHTNAFLWETTTGTLLHVLPHSFAISYAAFSPDRRRLVICTSDGTVFERYAQIWNVLAGTRIGPPLEHRDGVVHAIFSPEGKRVLTVSDDTTVRVWDSETGRPLLRLDHGAQLTEARFSPDGRWIVTACQDKTARIWDAENGEPVTPPLVHPYWFMHVQFAAGAKAVVTRTSGGGSAFWKLQMDEHPIADLTRLAQLLSGHQSDYTGEVLPQPRHALRDAWQKLRSSHPGDFVVTRREIVGWHTREAEASEKENQWAAARFHWEQLLRVEPENSRVKLRLDAATEKLTSLLEQSSLNLNLNSSD